ncbi:MAG: hypothetical protein ACD_19C00392G0002 [uncultured bacterium]|nr:MAG: hypothetical protein ACD_19C00392G0002 [uncultured bacterium]
MYFQYRYTGELNWKERRYKNIVLFPIVNGLPGIDLPYISINNKVVQPNKPITTKNGLTFFFSDFDNYYHVKIEIPPAKNTDWSELLAEDVEDPLNEKAIQFIVSELLSLILSKVVLPQHIALGRFSLA